MQTKCVNKVVLVGNLGADPETRFTPSGTQVTTASLATDESWTDRKGESRRRTEWHRLVLWRRLAEIAGQYLKKGSKVCVEGRLQTRSWEDAGGQRHYVTEVVVSDLKLIDSEGGPGEMDLAYGRDSMDELQQAGTALVGTAAASSTEASGMDDGLPF